MEDTPTGRQPLRLTFWRGALGYILITINGL